MSRGDGEKEYRNIEKVEGKDKVGVKRLESLDEVEVMMVMVRIQELKLVPREGGS